MHSSSAAALALRKALKAASNRMQYQKMKKARQLQEPPAGETGGEFEK